MGKNLSAGNLVQPLIRRSPGEKNGYPLQYSCLENLMDREEAARLQFTGSQRLGHD